MLLGEPAPEVDLSHLTHMRNPIAEANEVWVEALRGTPGPRDAGPPGRRDRPPAGRCSTPWTQEDFDAPSWTPAGRDETYGRFMRIRHYDCYLHEQDIRLALGLPLRETVEDLASALDEVATGLGYIVGRKAGTARRVTGADRPDRTAAPDLPGRGSTGGRRWSTPSTASRPWASSCSATRFLRLTGGRHDAGVADEDGVRFTGDRALGGQLVANLSFTI